MKLVVDLMCEDGDSVQVEIDRRMLRPYQITFAEYSGSEVTVALDRELAVQLWELLKHELQKEMVLSLEKKIDE